MKKKALNLFFALVLLGLNSFAQEHNSQIKSYLNDHYKDLGITKTDAKNWKIYNQHYDKSSSISYVYLLQTHDDIEIFNAIANFAISENGIVLGGNRMINDVESKVNTSTPILSPLEAITSACNALGIEQTQTELISIENGVSLYKKGSISQEDIPVKLVYVLDGDVIKLAWDLSIYELSGNHWWSIRIDALTGEEINKGDWVTSCKFDSDGHTQHSSTTDSQYKSNIPAGSPLMAPAPPPGTDEYRVFALPLESPNHGPRTLVVGPSDANASPYGWHDTDGTPGNEFTVTRGNNVRATEDVNDNNGFGYSPDAGAALSFDYPLNQNQDPTLYWDASVTNLFYTNNMMHDIWYQYGFDEVSGNFQSNSYGNGGISSDEVYAEAQDGGGTNNANFATPVDGQNPRMQMYIWDSAPASLLTINSPASIAGLYTATPAAFGGAMPVVPITTDFVLYDDNTGLDNNDACENAINGAAIAGKICIIRRGDCTFVDKIQRAQNFGAVAVIMVNNVGGGSITMGGTSGTITIPGIMVSQAVGESFIAQIEGGTTVNGTIVDVVTYPLDGDFDNGIIAHEYGHGISTRLTGGAGNSSCLNNSEQMGEGWSDWFGLMLTIEPGDVGTDNRGIGTFVTGEPTDGFGIRPVPYSTDFAVNDFTYVAVSWDGGGFPTNITEPHGIGFVWCTMLWDMTWAFIDAYGFDPDLYNGTGGNNMAMELVMQGLKLQPCQPGFVDGRDAILQADQLLNGGANQCLIWNAFAARGLGYSAYQGSSLNRLDQDEEFDMPPGMVNVTGSENVTSCADYTWSANGTTYNTTGSYVETLLSYTGCDSTATLNLTILPASSSTTTISNCNDYTWPANGTTYNTSGNYDVTLVNSLGCDSIATLDLTILNTTSSTTNLTECNSYVWAANGNTYTNSGLYSVSLTNAEGCDSTANLNLTITQSTSGTEVATNCIDYTWSANGTTYNSSGMYNATLMNAQGCDSLVTLDLTINSAYNEVQNIGSCTPYLWPANGNTYSVTGTDVANLTSISGCDSTVTLNFTLSATSSSSENVISCGDYIWPTTGLTYNTGGSYNVTLLGGSGCDSIVTLNLTIATPTVSSTNVSICDSYTWLTNGTTYNTSGIYNTVLVNSLGCDSTVTLDLTILPSTPTSTNTLVECDSYTWASNGTTYTGSGLFSDTYQNVNGCDSIVELDLTINQSTSSIQNTTMCDSYTWPENNVTYTSGGQYQAILTNAAGCDSTIDLTLIINSADVSTSFVDDITMTADLSGAAYEWVDCNDNYSLIGGATNQVYTATNNGDYAVIVTDNGCIDTSACMTVSVIGIIENNFDTEISVYPNPTNQDITIDLGGEYSDVVIRVTNALGQIIDVKHITSSSKVELSLDGAPGTYILEITTSEQGTARVRIVKD